MSFDVQLLNAHYIWFPNPYVYYNFTVDTPIASEGDRRLYGLCKFLLSLFFLALQLAYLLTLRKRRGYSSNFSFTLLYYIGIIDTLQLISHVVAGFMLITLMSSSEVLYIFGAILEGGYISTGYMTMALPIHRATYIMFPFKADKIFHPVLLKIVLGLYLVFSLFAIGYFFNKDAGNTYIPELVYWTFIYNPDKQALNDYMRFFELWSTLAPIIVGAVLYLLIIAKLSFRVGKYSKKEIKLTAQVFAILLVNAFSYVYWYHITGYVYTTQQKFFLRFIADMVWVLYNGMNPAIYYIFHKDIRHQMKFLLTLKCINTPQMTVDTASTSVPSVTTRRPHRNMAPSQVQPTVRSNRV